MKQKNKHHHSKKIILLLAFIVLAGSLLGVYKITRSDTLIQGGDENTKTTSVAPTAQENFSDGTERDPGNSVSENKGSGSIKDSEGGISATATDKSTWIKSGTGEITVYSPAKNSIIANGQEISGESTLSTISFRIIDDVSGVIGEGQLIVKEGKFSGSLDFTTSANEGRIDIFAIKTDGQEYSNIEIPIRFK